MKLSLSSLFLFPLLAASASSAKPLAQTQQGPIQGAHVHEKVLAFLGVPYAKPPLGELRFRPPEPLDACDGNRSVRKATRFGPACYQFRYQSVLGDSLAPTTPESEDCLSLNIFVPSSRHKSKLLPVLVWLYGGAFNEGSTSAPLFNPTGLVAEQPEIIVVTLNYRLNIFGFPNSPALSFDEQNLGIRDQRAALEWLRLNIGAFGGDPEKITLGGQSAGADSAAALTYTYRDDPIARSLILQSGVPEYIGPQDDTVFTQVAETVGCRNTLSRADELHCMKAVNARSLQNAMSNLTVNPFGTTGGAPMVDNITVFSVQDYLKLGAAGNFSRLPVLMGITDNEGDSVLNFSEKGGVNKTLSNILTTTFFNCPLAQEAL
ncbi:hypothetical protein FQN52_001289 [Onygenales sp. PD_12]|nr:hypothetical protein FQN52_001289 [Onygenales sp. PD_12]